MEVEFKSTIPAFWMVPDKKGSWISHAPLTVYVKALGMEFTIPAGSHNNLASIPPGARNLVPVNGPHRIAAVVHDYLYEMKGVLPEGDITREQADNIFLEIMKLPRDYIWSRFDDALKRILLGKYTSVAAAFASSKPLVGVIRRNLMHKAVRAAGWVFFNSSKSKARGRYGRRR